MTQVSGKISSSKPFVNKGLALVFTKVGGSASGIVNVDSDGTFKGEAPVGENVVCLYGIPQADAAHADPKSSKIKEAFWDASTTPWKVTVDSQGQVGMDFSLDATANSSVPASSHKAL